MKSLNDIIRKDLRVESIKRAIALAEQVAVAAKGHTLLEYGNNKPTM